MSALGQKQTFASQKAMSALPPKADMCGVASDVRFGPIEVMRALFDHLVGALLKLQGYIEAKRFGGLKVYHQFELGRLLHR
jgi:hypothetical protein